MKINGSFFITHGDATPLLEPVDTTFNDISAFIQFFIEERDA